MPNESQKAQLKAMQKYVQERAQDLGIAAETIASKRDLSAIVIDGGQNSKALSGWRREVLGDRILELA